MKLPQSLRSTAAAAMVLVTLAATASTWAGSGDADLTADGRSSFALQTQQGSRTIDITNITFMTTASHVPGRSPDERLLLRMTETSREVIDEKDLDATVTVEAWPLGADPTEAPLYAVTLDGVDATSRTMP